MLQSFSHVHFGGFTFFFKELLTYLLYLWAVLGLHCCTWAFSSCGEQRLLSRLLIGVGSVVVAHRLNCSIACGIFQNQGLNWCPLSPAGRFFTTEPAGKPLKSLFFFFLAAWHVGSSFPNQGLNMQPLHWKCSILTTGPPGKYRFHISFCHKSAGPNSRVCLCAYPIIP